MKFTGYGRSFSTVNNQQFDEIGKFWDEMSEIYGRNNLIGLCCHFTKISLMYYIGLKDNSKMQNHTNYDFISCSLPDDNWNSYFGYTDIIDSLYKNLICKDNVNPIVYELEELFDDGTCVIKVHRK